MNIDKDTLLKKSYNYWWASSSSFPNGLLQIDKKTKWKMEKDFYKGRINSNFGIEVVIPNNIEMNEIHKIIYTELCLGQIRDESKKILLKIIDRLKKDENIEGVILGCTELPLLIKTDDSEIPVFNTTEIHCKYAVEMSIK